MLLTSHFHGGCSKAPHMYRQFFIFRALHPAVPDPGVGEVVGRCGPPVGADWCLLLNEERTLLAPGRALGLNKGLKTGNILEATAGSESPAQPLYGCVTLGGSCHPSELTAFL